MDFKNFTIGNQFYSDNDNSTPFEPGQVYREHTFALYAKPVFILIGLITNFTSFIVLCRKPFSKSSAFLLPVAVSLAATFVAYFAAWLSDDVNISIRHTDATCALLVYFFGLVLTLPNWFLVAATIDRLAFIGGAQSKCRHVVAIVTIFVILFTLGGILTYTFWTTAVYEDNYTSYCYEPSKFASTTTLIFFVTVLIPEGLLMYLGFSLLLLSIVKLRDGNFQREQPVEKELTVTVLLVVVLHLIAAVPHDVFFMIFYIYEGVHETDILGILDVYSITLLVQMFLRSFLLFVSLLSSKMFRQSLTSCHGN